MTDDTPRSDQAIEIPPLEEFECDIHGVVGRRGHCPLCEIRFEQLERETV